MYEDKINELNELIILYSDKKLLNSTLKRIIIDNWNIILNSESFQKHINNIFLTHKSDSDKYFAIQYFYSCLKRFEIPITFREFCEKFNIPTKDILDSNNISYNLLNNIIEELKDFPVLSFRQTINNWKQGKHNQKAWDEFPSKKYFGIDEVPKETERIFNVEHPPKSTSKRSRNWRKELIDRYKINSEIKTTHEKNKKNVCENIDDVTINRFLQTKYIDEQYDIYTLIIIDPDFAIWSILAQRKTNFIAFNRNFRLNFEFVKGFTLKYNDQIFIRVPILTTLESIAKATKSFINKYQEYPIIGSINKIITEEYGYYIQSKIKRQYLNYINIEGSFNINYNLDTYYSEYIDNKNYPYVRNLDIPINTNDYKIVLDHTTILGLKQKRKVEKDRRKKKK